MLLTVILFIAVAFIASSSWVRRALPFESFLAVGAAGLIMVALLFTGQLA